MVKHMIGSQIHKMLLITYIDHLMVTNVMWTYHLVNHYDVNLKNLWYTPKTFSIIKTY
jgi:hypothetical protein